MRRAATIGLAVALCLLGAAAPARAQFGALVSPGPLAKAHASLEGAGNCEKCHEAGRKVTADRCLVCHAPIAKRIAAHVGVHANVAGDCVRCHVEHAGVDGELRPFDPAKFNHTTQTGFPLDGKHAAVAAKCGSCHKTRSYLTAGTTCASCHNDVHKGSLGTACERCHSTKDAFVSAKATFDHQTTKFPLVGAHRNAACSACHTAGSFAVAKFSTCLDCHQTPHPKTVSTTCASCHTNETWSTRKFDHATTAFPLTGKHAAVACATCHKGSMMKVKLPSSTCATCHADPHQGEFKQDCKACHSDTKWAGASFDHATTRFALTDGHAGPSCKSCHSGFAVEGRPIAQMTADFRGAKTTCTSCHADPHRGELGSGCESCHAVKAFTVSSFTHPRAADLFVGRHAAVACDKCHTPQASSTASGAPATGAIRLAAAAFTTTPTVCASCHRDVHLGQLGAACATCHSAAANTFGVAGFDHNRTSFHLAGAHQKLVCAQCHKTETANYPAGRGIATRFTGVGTTCASCHADVHLGQLASTCETCHRNDTFKIPSYVHQSPPAGFFVGAHMKATCAQCHKAATAAFPAGRGTAVRFAMSAQCVACHEDIHKGALGDNCASCHKAEPLVPSHASASLARPRALPTHSGVGA